VDLGVLVDRGAEQVAILPQADRNVLLGDHQHPTGAAARIIDRAHDTLRPDTVLVAGQHQVRHEVHDIARREVLARILVQCFVKLAD
jgi:hypothetical protein